MTTLSSVSVSPVSVQSPAGSYVDWPAIFAGTVVATGISILFVTFGSALGLSIAGLKSGNANAAWMAIALGLWLIWVQISGLIAGSYVTGRMRRRIGDAQPHEVEMRDGMHGLTVWGLSIIFGTMVGAQVVMTGASGLASTGSGVITALSTDDNMRLVADRLLRSTAPPTNESQTNSNQPTSDQSAADQDDFVAEITRILGASVVNRFMLDDNDKTYVVSHIARRTGVTPDEARGRLDAVLTSLAETARTARRIGIIAAFAAAATLLLGALASWWSATLAGGHRDRGIDHSRHVAWR